MGIRLKNKVAVVTGAGAGIGRKTVERFVTEGACVWAIDISDKSLMTLNREYPSVRAFKADVTDRADIALLARETSDIDILFNCAGYVHSGPLLTCDRDAWDFSLGLNVTSSYEMIKAFLPGMIKKKAGSIVNMSSVASSLKGVVNRCAYGASKAAVIGLTKSVAADYVKDGIRCNAICPGTVDTPSLRERIAAFPDPELAEQKFIGRQPMERLGTALEIADLAVYLASDESSYTTGAAIVIDGGWSN